MKKLFCVMLALVMILAMAACADENKEAYEQAIAAYEGGYYEDAANKLAALGDYKDAAELLATISAEKASAIVEVATADGTVKTEVSYVVKDGNVIKETITYADGAVTKNYYKFDDNGNCTSQILNQVDGSKININNFYENGVIVRTVRTNANGLKDTYEYTCDESGKITAHTLTFSDNSAEEATYSYNEAGQLTVISTGATTTTYEYNAFGDVVKEAVAEGSTVISSTTYAYAYTFIVG